MRLGLAISGLLLFACTVEVGCEWETLAPYGWDPVNVENGCNLPTMDTDLLGCGRYLNPMQQGEGCTKGAEWICGNGVTVTLVIFRHPDRGEFTANGPDGCQTTAHLVPAEF
jgi:hypothetical protein